MRDDDFARLLRAMLIVVFLGLALGLIMQMQVIMAGIRQILEVLP